MFVAQRKWGTPARQRNTTHVKLKRICDIQMELEIQNKSQSCEIVCTRQNCEINETTEMTKSKLIQPN